MARPLGPDRDRMLDAAQHLFAEHGYDGVSLRAISAMAGTQQSLLHYHFKGKQELYEALWERWFAMPRLAPGKDHDALGHAEKPAIEDKVRAAVTRFFDGPRFLAQSARGQVFLEIVIREFSDPKSEERGLLKRFIGPSQLAFQQDLKAAFGDIEVDLVNAMYKIVASTVQVLITPDQTAAGPTRSIDFDMLVEFSTAGLLAHLRGS